MFPFVPRSVTRKPGKPPNIRIRDISRSLIPPTMGEPGTSLEASKRENPFWISSQGKEKAKDASVTAVADEEWATLAYLSLSEYALWLDTELRRRMETDLEGYIPLTYIMERSAYFSALDNKPAEVVVAKSIRTHASHFFEVQMRTSLSSRSKNNAFKGEFEVRHKDLQNVLERTRKHTKQEWENLTVYIESIPLQYRSMLGINRFVQQIIEHEHPTVSSSTPTMPFVQRISFPRHFQDQPNDIPKCKGFALITLFSPELAKILVDSWPWQRRSAAHFDVHSSLAHDAQRFGFRALSKVRWDALNDVYLSYRQSILDQISATEDHEMSSSRPIEPSTEDVVRTVDATTSIIPELKPLVSGQTTAESLYPHNCLVFVRNVRPDTNKTTLRSLFSPAFLAHELELPPGDGIDYVDYNRHITTCFLRVTTPAHAQALINYFTRTPTTQTSFIDGTGHPPSGDHKAITMELITSTREELYWGNVPEKARKQAVKRVVDLENGFAEDIEMEEPTKEKKRRRKRRKLVA